MTDFNTAIETRLEAFRRLHGRGNVRDSGNILFEIVQLMYAMLKTPEQPPSAQVEDEIVQSVVTATSALPFQMELSPESISKVEEVAAEPIIEETMVEDVMPMRETVAAETMEPVAEPVAEPVEDHTAQARRAKGKK